MRSGSHSRTSGGSATYWAKLAPVLARLPADALGAAARPREVCCWWREQTAASETEAALESLYAILKEILKIQMVEDETLRISEALDDDDAGDDATR